jgi:hypothetical protein
VIERNINRIYAILVEYKIFPDKEFNGLATNGNLKMFSPEIGFIDGNFGVYLLSKSKFFGSLDIKEIHTDRIATTALRGIMIYGQT